MMAFSSTVVKFEQCDGFSLSFLRLGFREKWIELRHLNLYLVKKIIIF
jgi:hypothetical protein